MSTSAPKSPSKRWVTTTQSSLENVANLVKGAEINPSQRVKDLRDRKLANTKTSILFGNSATSYQSDARDSQKSVMKGFDLDERKVQMLRNKNMKMELTRSNFSLGDEKTEYDTTAKAGLRAGSSGVTGRQELFKPGRESSVQFGNEKTDYRSVAQESMVFHGNSNDFSAMKNDVLALKTHLRRHQISLGEEKVEYVTDNQRGYPSIGAENYDHKGRKEELRKVIDETRKCHFSFGQDSTEYLSNAHRAQKNVSTSSGNDFQRELDNAKKMKQQLQRTSFVVGVDPEYD